MITNKINEKLRKEVIARLMEHLQTDNYAKLSRALGCNTRQHLDNCFSRGNIPTNRIINYALKAGIDLNYLFRQPMSEQDKESAFDYGNKSSVTQKT